jgi:glucose-1-phosphate thymidylyltransferase
MSTRKTLGIILAAGKSSRLYPATTAVTKQLLPVYDKPLVYYPLSTLMLGGIRDFLIIVNESEKPIFEKLFESALIHMGINIQIVTQEKPNGLPEAFIIAKKAINYDQYDSFALILGDNIFHGSGLTGALNKGLLALAKNQATIYAQKAVDLFRFGVVSINRVSGNPVSLVEKPVTLDDRFDNYAITGMYIFPKNASSIAEGLKPSQRGELEITDLINVYFHNDLLNAVVLPRGMSWFDTGTENSLLDAANYIKTIQVNQGLLIGSPHEVGFRNKWVEDADVMNYYKYVSKSNYGALLKDAFLYGTY